MIDKIYNRLVPQTLKHDVIAYTNAKNIINIALISAAAIPFYAIIYYLFDDLKSSYYLLMLGFFYLFSVWILQAIGSLLVSREILVGSLFLCLLLISYNTGGFHSAASIWFVLPPLLAIVCGNVISGIFWAFASVITVTILFLFTYLNISLPEYHISNKLLLDFYSYSGLVAVIFLLAYFFDLGKREAILKFALAKQESDYLAQEAQEAVHAKNEFLENMSHELRTPLNSIMGFSELIAQKKVDVNSYNELNSIILSSSKELTRMIEEMLSMSQVKLGKMEFIPANIDLSELINEVQMAFHDKLAEKKLNLSVNIDPKIKTITTDPDKLRLMLSCYLSNAIKYSDKGKSIEIRAFSLSPNEFCFEIEDQGIGIKEEDLGKLFMPFAQVDMSATKKFQGIGIGLALTRRIAEAQGGRVGVKSEIGKGSIFSVTLPKK